MMPHEQRQLEQLAARGFFEEVHHPLTGTTPHATFPVRFSSMEGPYHRRYSPTLGEHNREILHDLLRFSDEEIDQLERHRVIGTAPRVAS